MNATLVEPAPAKLRIGLEEFTVGSFTLGVTVRPLDEENFDLLVEAHQHEHLMRQFSGFCA